MGPKPPDLTLLSSQSDCIRFIALGFSSSTPTNCPSDFRSVEYQWIFWLSLCTAALFVGLSLLRIAHLLRPSTTISSAHNERPSTRAPTKLLAGKLIAVTALVGLRLGLLLVALDGDVFSSSRPSGQLIASLALSLSAACLLLILSPLEHFRSPRPSLIACTYLFLSTLYDLTRCPTLWSTYRGHGILSDSTTITTATANDAGLGSFTVLFTASTVVEAVLLILESMQRNRWVAWNDDQEEHSPEETSSVLSLGLYSWLIALLWRGYHEPLTMKTLYPLDRDISIDTLDAQTGNSTSDSAKGTSTFDILRWIITPLGRSLFLPVLPRLCLLGFTFCQPFFLNRLLRYLSSSTNQQDPSSSSTSTASGLIAVATLTYFGIAITTSLYWYYQERFQSLLRGYLIAAVYRKTGKVPHIGDGDQTAVTLIGADVERIYTGVRLIHEIWANAIQIGLAGWLLQRQLGLAFLAPLIVVIAGFAASFTLSKYAVKYQSAWMTRVQSRISFTSSILSRIKDLRVSGMIRPAATLLQQQREDEITVGEKSRMLIATSATLSQLPQAVAPALAFAFGPRVLDQTRAFTALSYLTLLTAPLLVVLQSLPIVAACLACLRRIKEFIDQEDKMDERTIGLIDADGQGQLGPGLGLDHQDASEVSISIRDASFGWTPELSSPALKHINLSLRRSSTTFVLGPVACGKSTLCRALLGEVSHLHTGTIALSSSKIAYCDQTPFLFNASIAENIIGFSAYNAHRYEEVIQASMLSADLQTLPQGDATVIGSKGLSLSGGQKQRVSLARALYHDADILILDDVFSGLDGATQIQVCRAVFGAGGLLRRRGTTTLVCTHAARFARVADWVVVLGSDGEVERQGKFVDVARDEEVAGRYDLDGAADELSALSVSVPKEEEKNDEEPFISETAKTSTIVTTGPLRLSSSKAALPIQSSLGRPRPSSPTPERIPPPTVDTVVYRHWLSTLGLFPLLFYTTLVLGVGFFANFPTIWLKLWSADSTSSSPSHPFSFWIGIYVLLGTGTILCVFPAGLVMLRTGVRLAGTSLHLKVVETVTHSSLRFLTSTDVGKVLNLFSQDMNILDTQLPRMANNMCFSLATAVGQAVVIAYSSGWLALSYPFFAMLLWGVQKVYLPSSKRLRILDLEAKTPLYTNLLDTISGLPTIRAYGWFPHQLLLNNHLLDDSQRPSYLLAMAQQWLMLTMNMVVGVIAVLLVTLATQLGSNEEDSTTSAGSVGAGLVTLITLGGSLTTIVIAYTGLETSLGAVGRLMAFGEETELEDGQSQRQQQFDEDEDEVENEEVDAAWPRHGRVMMQGVKASYNGVDKVLDGVTFTVEPGDKVALCGRTGSGKSTILSLLLRLVDPLPTVLPSTIEYTAPCPILIDGIPLSSINRDILRERIISASQDPVFLPDGTSFRTNLDPWSSSTDAECNIVLNDLDLFDLVIAKGGLSAPITSAELSAGQKQLFSLARAALQRRVKKRRLMQERASHDSSTTITSVSSVQEGGLLLLDEITASADAETERRVWSVLEEEFREYTVLMVTHHREMAVACDRVVVLDGGKVVEEGRPGELLQREGWFRGLWEGGDGV